MLETIVKNNVETFGIVSNNKELSISLEDMSRIMSYLIKDLASDKLKYSLQETISNAYDATIRTGKDIMQHPIMISVSYKEIKIRDNGNGIDEEIMDNYFFGLGKSDKRNKADELGKWGLGSLSPFAVTESFLVTSVKDGKKRCWNLFRENQIPFNNLLFVEESTEDNHTIVSWNIDYKYNTIEKVKEVCNYMPFVYIEGEDEWNKELIYDTGSALIRMSKTQQSIENEAVLGNVIYDVSKFSKDVSYFPFAVKIQLTDGVSPSINREQLEYNKESIELVKKRSQEAFDSICKLGHYDSLITCINKNFKVVLDKEKDIFLYVANKYNSKPTYDRRHYELVYNFNLSDFNYKSYGSSYHTLEVIFIKEKVNRLPIGLKCYCDTLDRKVIVIQDNLPTILKNQITDTYKQVSKKELLLFKREEVKKKNEVKEQLRLKKEKEKLSKIFTYDKQEIDLNKKSYYVCFFKEDEEDFKDSLDRRLFYKFSVLKFKDEFDESYIKLKHKLIYYKDIKEGKHKGIVRMISRNLVQRKLKSIVSNVFSNYLSNQLEDFRIKILEIIRKDIKPFQYLEEYYLDNNLINQWELNCLDSKFVEKFSIINKNEKKRTLS